MAGEQLMIDSTQQEYYRSRASTGIAGLDQILGGGLADKRIHLLTGAPGTGKTTFAMQFLLEGARRGESSLFVSLLQTREELNDIARSHGWSLDDLTILMLPRHLIEAAGAEQTVFSTADIELDEVMKAILDAIESLKPSRMALDSVTELEVLIDNPHQLRSQLIRLRNALLAVPTTAILTAGESLVANHPSVQTIVHGSILLRQDAPGYGETRRRLEIEKSRATKYEGGFHDFLICTGGIEVFPRLSANSGPTHPGRTISSGNQELDKMLGDGIQMGSATLMVGTSGSGKSTFVSHYVQAVAEAGELATVYCFDESRQTYIQRSRGLDLDIVRHIDEGLVDLREYNVGDLTPSQLMSDVCADVERREAKLVVIDSFSGYLSVMPYEEHPTVKLHEILRYLSSRGVATLVTMNLHGLVGPVDPDVDISYLVDSVIFMRHFEALGSVRRCISVLKKRHGTHEKTIREIEIVRGGLRLGQPLHEFTGVLSGTPQYVGRREDLLGRESDRT
jgi:circadian clock protein KaiC